MDRPNLTKVRLLIQTSILSRSEAVPNPGFQKARKPSNIVSGIQAKKKDGGRSSPKINVYVTFYDEEIGDEKEKIAHRVAFDVDKKAAAA